MSRKGDINHQFLEEKVFGKPNSAGAP